MCVYMCVCECVCVNVFLYMYVYVYQKKGRERERVTEKKNLHQCREGEAPFTSSHQAALNSKIAIGIHQLLNS